MIGVLQGTVFAKRNNSVIIMIGGVGYSVWITQSLFSDIQIKDSLTLYTYTHVRKDTLELFGFSNQEQLRLFELIIAISGIGPKRALLVIDRGAKDIEQAVISADVSFFTAIPRLGKKNAQKIIIELKSKLGDTGELDLSGEPDGKAKEIISALSSLGFKKHEVLPVLPTVLKSNKSVEEQIKYALKLLGNKNNAG